LAAAALATSLAALAEIKPNDPLPIGPQVQVGKLANGLTYYIQKNGRPEKKLELRLVVKAGSILEDNDQLGLAHLMEHMAFNGSTHFKKHELISYLQSIGVKFGADLNAYTSFDETVYILPVPTDKPEIVEKAFLILQDWAQGVALKEEDIDAERNIVLEELRLGKGAQDRMSKQFLPKLFDGSKYAHRLPIGTEESLKGFKAEALRRFYKDWYRPDLMAVVVVGDMEPAKAQAMVEQHFSALKNPANERPRDYERIPARSKFEALVVTDQEATNNTVQILSPASERKPELTIGDYRQQLVEGLFNSMLSVRNQELTQKANPPFVGGGSGMSGFIRGYRMFSASAMLGQAGVAPAVDALVQESSRARQFGFTQDELDRAKKNHQRNMERAYEERDKTDSGVFAAEYIRNFLVQEAIPGLDNERTYVRELFPTIQLAEVNRYAQAVIPEKSALLAVYMGASKDTATTPAEPQLLASVLAARDKAVTAHEEKKLPASLMPVPPKPGSIVAEKQVPALGLTQLTLSNGVQVWLKPTDFKSDQVLMSAVRHGGQSLVAQEDAFTARYTPLIVNAMGLKDYSPTDVSKILAGKTANAGLNTGFYTDSANGSSGHDEVETMLQRLYLSFGPARRDADLYQSFISRTRDVVKNMLERPEAIFADTQQKTLYNNHPRLPLMPRPGDFDQVRLDRVLALHQQRFSSAKGFTFVFVGSFELEKIKPLIATYIASLPTPDLPTEYKDLGLRPVSGVVKKDVYAGKEAKSQVSLTFTGPATYSREESLRVNALLEVLNIRLVDELREKLTLIYSGHIGGGLARQPYEHYSISAGFPCAPENVDKVIAAAFAEFQKIKDSGAQPQDLEKVKQNWLIGHRRSLRENGYWLGQFFNAINNGTDPAELLTYEQRVAAVTPEQLKETAQRYLRSDNYLQMVLYPEKTDKAEKTAKN
jgi:zinc protease